MVFIEEGVYKTERITCPPSDTFCGTLEHIRNGVNYLIEKYGLDAELDEFDELRYIDNATEDEIKSYLKEQENIEKLRLKKEKQEKVLYEKLKKKYENT